jgi:hypothetical protein
MISLEIVGLSGYNECLRIKKHQAELLLQYLQLTKHANQKRKIK